VRLSTKLTVGAAAGLLPFLVGQPSAAAAFKADDDGGVVTYISTGGSRVNCSLSAAHTVDSDSGELTATLSTGTNCRGGLQIVASYVDRHGDVVRSSASARSTQFLTLKEFNAGSTAVTVDHTVELANCASNCSHTLQTKTK